MRLQRTIPSALAAEPDVGQSNATERTTQDQGTYRS